MSGRPRGAVGRAGSARAWLAGCAVLLLVGACASPEGGSDPDGGVANDQPSGELSVFAAASLIDAFEELREAFHDAYPDVEVVFNHAGSQTLANQINEGAPADVFASADGTQMEVVADAGNLAAAAEVFIANRLEIAVEPGNPLGIEGLADLADPEVVLVLPAEEVPAGRYAGQALDAAGVEPSPASLERDVRAALSKVELGEADATIVYASDIVASSGRAEGVVIPADQSVLVTYPIAVLDDASNREAAEAFVAFVLDDEGQEILLGHGFTAP